MRRLYYGWWVTGACFLFVGARRGSETAYGVLLVALTQEFGWERATITGAFSLAMLIGGLCTPWAGRLLDRFDPRLLFGIGALTLGAAVLALTQIQQVVHLYLIMATLYAMTLAALELGTLSAYLARWFVRRRAMAFGLSQAGQGLGIFLLTPLVTWLITLFGWRLGYALLGAGLLLLLLPVTFLVLRSSPERLGLLPDGVALPPESRAHAPGRAAGTLESGAWTLAQARRTRVFWALLLCFYFFPASNQVFHIHLVAYLTDLGLDKLQAAFVLSIAGLMSVLGRLMFGLLTDRYGGIIATQISFAFSILGVLLILLPQATTPLFLYVFAVIFGLSLGSRGVTLGALTANAFPGREFGAIYGWITSGQLIGGALGPWLGGLIFDYTGSYRIAFYGCIGGFLLSAALVWLASWGPRPNPEAGLVAAGEETA
ncbi:MAG: MFS transporter [Candidatus Tectimicrobiota bacterium]